MKYSDLSTFFGGLAAKIGPPNSKVSKAMEEEHTASADSKHAFTTSNYGVTTTPERSRATSDAAAPIDVA